MDPCRRCGTAGTVVCPNCKREGKTRKPQGIDDIGRAPQWVLCNHRDSHATGQINCPTCGGRGRLQVISCAGARPLRC